MVTGPIVVVVATVSIALVFPMDGSDLLTHPIPLPFMFERIKGGRARGAPFPDEVDPAHEKTTHVSYVADV